MSEQFFYPRPEYPRPDFRRGMVEGFDWLNLNGPWQFRFDGRRQGLARANPGPVLLGIPGRLGRSGGGRQRQFLFDPRLPKSA